MDGAQPSALRDIIAGVVTEFVELNGQPTERVSGVRKTDSGWSILVDVVDVERIPATTSVLSTFRVDADDKGHLCGYERIRRFTRAAVDGR